ncbi:Sec39p [Nakaseomyces bracarensis]|uniref:Sec39p n=1 Tax=Nakaseomyces bracarensis TaxID=273131 RepID=UPI0038719745
MSSLAEKKVVLLASVFCSRADVKSLRLLLPHFNDHRALLFQLVLVLWPELEAPLSLMFLFDEEHLVAEENPDETIVKSLEIDSTLIPLVECSPDIVLERYTRLLSFIGSKLPQTMHIDQDIGPSSNWIRARVILCNDYDRNLILFYQPLWSHLKIDDDEFNAWVKGVLEPLKNAQNWLGNKSIEEFMSMESKDRLELLINGNSLTNDLSYFNRIILPVILYYRDQDLRYFIEHYVTKDTFHLKSKNDILLLIELCTHCKDNDLSARVFGILYENSHNYFATYTNRNDDSELRRLLGDIHNEDSEVYTRLLDLIRDINDHKHFNSFKDLFQIQEGTESQQFDLFTIYCRSLKLENVSKFVLEKDFLFNKLTTRAKLEIMVESLFERDDYSKISSLLDKDKNEEDKKLLVKNFWKYYYQSENVNDKSFHTLEQILKLLTSKYTNNDEINQLSELTEVVNELSRFSINLPPHGFKPHYVLTYKERAIDIISNILELNPKLYKQPERTLSILTKLNQCFNKPTNTKTASKLLTLHIDHALVNRDFMYAYKLSKDWFALIKAQDKDALNDIGNQWLTIFQVGKYMDPDWPDAEIPTEILILQMELLSDLFQYAPADQVEIIANQWSALEIELSIRDLVNDHTSVGNMNSNMQFIQNGLTEVSHTMAAFLGHRK